MTRSLITRQPAGIDCVGKIHMHAFHSIWESLSDFVVGRVWMDGMHACMVVAVGDNGRQICTATRGYSITPSLPPFLPTLIASSCICMSQLHARMNVRYSCGSCACACAVCSVIKIQLSRTHGYCT
jgi:hypothetical protein